MYEDIECGTRIKDLELGVGEFVGYCPVCGEKLVVKTGRFGKFVGCEGFKRWINCRKTYNYNTFELTNYDALAHHNVERKTKYLKKEIDKWSIKNPTRYNADKIREIIDSTNYREIKKYGEDALKEIRRFEEWDANY